MFAKMLSNEKNVSLVLNNKKVSYSIKRLLKQLFKQSKSSKLNEIEQKDNDTNNCSKSIVSLEDLQNQSNSEAEHTSVEPLENEANERISCQLEDYDFADLCGSVPVHFMHTDCGVFFWSASVNVPADNDLIEPLHCGTSNQIACSQIADRWAQA